MQNERNLILPPPAAFRITGRGDCFTQKIFIIMITSGTTKPSNPPTGKFLKPEDVLTELPDLVEVEEWLPLSEHDRLYYRSAVSEGNFMGMRQAAMLGGKRSEKLQRLLEIVDEARDNERRVLVFSQFVQMLTLLEKECRVRNISTHLLTGQTKDRQEVVNAFQNDPNPGVFLLSLRAAGTGLNLTNASYVVLYDPWWNPAVEAQAIDRSHRIGQTQTVNAYRLIAPGTVEEKIWELQQSKAKTIADVLGEEGFARSLTKTELEYLFSED